MADEHRHPHASRGELDFGIKNLLGLHHLLPLFLGVAVLHEHVDLRDDIEGDALGEIENKTFPKRIAFNVIPQIDVFMEDGYTKEEWKMMMETKKILDPKIKLTATCVRVPVFVGHSEAVNIEFENPISV